MEISGTTKTPSSFPPEPKGVWLKLRRRKAALQAKWFLSPLQRAQFQPDGFSLRLKNISWCSLCLGGFIFVLFLFALPALAQDALDDGVVTADEVNMVARRLYCPVCPNERLDACQTQACVNWRDDIRVQLEAGRTEDQIVVDFVARYGERAAGVPIDPTLNALSVYTPYVIAVLALAVGVFTFLRWRSRRPPPQPVYDTTSGSNEPDQAYRSALERDVGE